MKKTAFITGASSGIGSALALELTGQGYRLALAARRESALAELAAHVRQRGGEALTLACDVQNPAQVEQAIATTLAHYDRIDLAILSAGIGRPTEPLKFNAAALVDMTATNYFGVAYCLEHLIPALLKQQPQGGTIAVLSSLAGDRGMPGFSGYGATKAALNALCDGLRAQLARERIRLVTVAPGYVRTPMTAHNPVMPFLMEADAAARLILRRIERGDRLIRFPLVPSLFMRLMKWLPVSLFDAILGKRQPVRINKPESDPQ